MHLTHSNPSRLDISGLDVLQKANFISNSRIQIGPKVVRVRGWRARARGMLGTPPSPIAEGGQLLARKWSETGKATAKAKRTRPRAPE